MEMLVGMRRLLIRGAAWMAAQVIESLVFGFSGFLCVLGVLAVMTLAGLWPLPKPFYEGYWFYAVTGVMVLVMLAGGFHAESRIMRRLRARWPWLA